MYCNLERISGKHQTTEEAHRFRLMKPSRYERIVLSALEVSMDVVSCRCCKTEEKNSHHISDSYKKKIKSEEQLLKKE